MNERPIIFTGESARAILAGRKTQTRRLVREPLASSLTSGGWPNAPPLEIAYVAQRCPYRGADHLWVRETWASVDHRGEWAQSVRTADDTDRILYRADDERVAPPPSGGRWLTPLYMPRRASRLTLEVVAIRVERLQSISEADAMAEGVDTTAPTSARINGEPGQVHCFGPTAARMTFAFLWDGINGKRAPWASNPWVWVVEFQRAGAP